MENVVQFMQQDWINSLGWMLLHSLWQHALIALSCALILACYRHASANTRYLAALASLLLALFTSATTFYSYQKNSTNIVIHPTLADEPLSQIENSLHWGFVDFINTCINNIAFIWMLVVAAIGIKILVDYRYCQYLKTDNLTTTPEKWNSIFMELARTIGISRSIELRISLVAISPCVIGHIKPVVLLPMKLLLCMSQEQIEAILLHELAHIHRQDYLLGIIQTLIKTLFFFNPFLLWISSQIDKEREHACDDIAVTINQNPLLFANTLKELAEMNTNKKIAMNINHKNLLLQRVTRLFKKQKNESAMKAGSATGLAILLSGLLIAICANATPDKIENKIISLDVAKISAHEVMKEVNKKCGTAEVLAKADNDEITLVLEDISCKDAIKLLKDFAAGAPESL